MFRRFVAKCFLKLTFTARLSQIVDCQEIEYVQSLVISYLKTQRTSKSSRSVLPLLFLLVATGELKSWIGAGKS